jgi:hypothetical protein
MAELPAKAKSIAVADLDEDDGYRESEDEDFDINADNNMSGEESSDEGQGEVGPNTSGRARKRRKISTEDTVPARHGRGEEDGDDYVGELDSGDEATIRKAKKKKGGKKGKRKGISGEDGGDSDGEDWEGMESSGGEGGFVRTRAMRAQE